MEGKKDYRRSSVKEDRSAYATWSREAASVTQNSVPVGVAPISRSTDVTSPASTSTESILPRHYLIIPLPTASTEDIIIHETVLINTLRSITSTVPSQPLPWTPANLTVYGRLLRIPAQHAGIALFTFDQLCGAVLGPADYVTLASTYHTMIITSVPVLGFSQKNEARRFITLLDATYEARCRLLITAMAGPDHIFFPVPSSSHTTVSPSNTQDDLESDVVYAETYSEIHQDLTSPFRPNISSYNHSTTKHNKLPTDALENNPHNRARRPWSSSKEERKGTSPPDFANIRGLTGADEVFAVRRAESRLWEMCSERWWNRVGVDRLHTDGANGGIMEWWRPLPLALRHWERSQPKELEDVDVERIAVRNKSDSQEKAPPSDGVEGMFAHGASPFRTVDDAPPKIWATHIWGMVKWGKKAGAWGKGVAGLEERNRKQQATHHGSPDDDKKH
jgi:protein AFG1